MKRLVIDIKTCKDCPYLRWLENTGCGNYSGWSYCEKTANHIERSNEHPDIPVWCPLPEAG